jgi:hypothetical protein
MAASLLILLIYVAVMAAVLYLAVRYGVRDGMTDFEKSGFNSWSSFTR